MTAVSPNLISGEMSATITDEYTITGIVTASWSSPAADCESGNGNSRSREGSMTATFDVVLP